MFKVETSLIRILTSNNLFFLCVSCFSFYSKWYVERTYPNTAGGKKYKGDNNEDNCKDSTYRPINIQGSDDESCYNPDHPVDHSHIFFHDLLFGFNFESIG